MENEIYIYLIGAGISLAIFYFIIKAAVSAANSKLEEQFQRIVNLQVLDLKLKGVDTESLKRASGFYEDMKKLKEGGSISQNEYNEIKAKKEGIFSV
jgi:chlorite dismutase